MKNAATIFLLALLVSTQTPAGQFLKLPLLIEHFIKHQQQEGLSLLDFLEEHYARDHHDADWPEDEQLPFKNVSIHSIGYALVTPVLQTNEPTLLPADKKVIIPGNSTPQQYPSSIFHPPRV